MFYEGANYILRAEVNSEIEGKKIDMNHLVFGMKFTQYCFIKFAVDSNSGIELLDNQTKLRISLQLPLMAGGGGGGGS